MEKENQKSEAVCPGKLELAEVKDKLARAKSGPQYWRSLEELAQTDGFFEMLHREFPRQASVWPEGASRRDFLKLMSASMALAGLSACVKQPLEPIVPLRSAATPARAGQAALLRQHHAVRWLWPAGAGREPRRASHQD